MHSDWLPEKVNKFADWSKTKLSPVTAILFSDVKDISIDMDKQRVYVTSDASAEDLLAVIKKTGKKTSYIGTA